MGAGSSGCQFWKCSAWRRHGAIGKEKCIRHLEVEDVNLYECRARERNVESAIIAFSVFTAFSIPQGFTLKFNAGVLFMLIINLIYLEDSFLLGCHLTLQTYFSQ